MAAGTVSRLMAHASGLPDYTAQPRFDPARVRSRAEILALVRDVPVAFAPGAEVAASATDFLLLGLVVEHASGMSYEAYVTKNQIERLHLKNTMFASGLPAVKQEVLAAPGAKHKAFLTERPFIDPTETATGYVAKDGTLVSVRDPHDGVWFGHQAIFASAEDISLWDIGLAGGLLVGLKDNRDVLYNPTTIDGGTVVPAHAGWRFPKHTGLMDIEGNVPGYSCYLARFTAPTELLCVTLCGNRDGVDFTDLGRRIAGAFDPKLGPPAGEDEPRERVLGPVTVDRLKAFLHSKGVQVSTKTSHASTELIVKSWRILVWQEADGTVWAGYDDMADLAEQVQAAVKYATAPY